MRATTLLLFGLLLAGCNTMEGMGEDTEEAGEAVEEEASEY
ncbi:MAG: entericidin A/B family lipoprotein [Halofilum sp. (in: g-proteobacteria)]